MQGLAGHVAAELRVVLLGLHVAGVEENGQAEGLEAVDVLAPGVVVELQLERQGPVVRQVQHLRHRVRQF